MLHSWTPRAGTVDNVTDWKSASSQATWRSTTTRLCGHQRSSKTCDTFANAEDHDFENIKHIATALRNDRRSTTTYLAPTNVLVGKYVMLCEIVSFTEDRQ